MTVKISKKGWVVIPAELRKKYDLEPGMEVHVVDYGGVLSLVLVEVDPIEATAGMLKSNKSLTDVLLEEHLEERKRERN